MKKTTKSPASRSRRTPGRRQGYRPTVSLGSIQEGVSNMSVTNSLLAGTPSKRSSQTFGSNTRRDHVTNLTKSERTSTKGRSDDKNKTSTRTSTIGESFAENHQNAANLSSEETVTDAKADVPIRIVANCFNISDDVEEEIDNLSGEVIHCDQKNPWGLVHEMTVLVAAGRNAPVNPHTTPILVAMSRGVPIVRHEWLTKSLKQGRFLPMDKYLLKDDSAAEGIDVAKNLYDAFFPLSRAIENGIEASSKGGILGGYLFVLCPDVEKSEEDFTKKELRVLLEAAGARKLTKPMLEAGDKFDNLLVVTSTTATDEQIKFVSKFETVGGMRVNIFLALQMLLFQSKTPLERLIKAKERAAAKKEAAFQCVATGSKELLRMELVEVNRTLSKPNEGDKNRGSLGRGGTLQIVESGSKKYVLYFDQDRTLKFKATAPTKALARNERSVFGNSGKQHVFAWEVTNESGDQTMWRRYFFWFHRREQLDMFLVILFGVDVDPSTNQSILEEWYDESGKFCENESNVPAHVIVKDEDVMDEEFPVRKTVKPRAAEICEHGCDPYEASQQIY